MLKTIGIVGEDDDKSQTHTALNASLDHVRQKFALSFDHEWIDTERVEKEGDTLLEKYAGIGSATGSPFKSLDGALRAIRFARTGNISHPIFTRFIQSSLQK